MNEEDFEGEILEYFDDEYQEYWRNEIRRGDWDRSEELYNLLENKEFKSKYGDNSKVLLLCDGESINTFCAYCGKNEKYDSCYLDYLFTFPSSRNNGFAQLAIDLVCNMARDDENTVIYTEAENPAIFLSRGFEEENIFTDDKGERKYILKKDL